MRTPIVAQSRNTNATANSKPDLRSNFLTHRRQGFGCPRRKQPARAPAAPTARRPGYSGIGAAGTQQLWKLLAGYCNVLSHILLQPEGAGLRSHRSVECCCEDAACRWRCLDCLPVLQLNRPKQHMQGDILIQRLYRDDVECVSHSRNLVCLECCTPTNQRMVMHSSDTMLQNLQYRARC